MFTFIIWRPAAPFLNNSVIVVLDCRILQIYWRLVNRVLAAFWLQWGWRHNIRDPSALLLFRSPDLSLRNHRNYMVIKGHLVTGSVRVFSGTIDYVQLWSLLHSAEKLNLLVAEQHLLRNPLFVLSDGICFLNEGNKVLGIHLHAVFLLTNRLIELKSLDLVASVGPVGDVFQENEKLNQL